MTDDRGTFIHHDGRPAVRFVRRYPHPIDRVWGAVSEPAQLVRWFPSSVALDPRAGGEIRFDDDPHMEATVGTVLAYEPPHRLAFTWGGDELHLTLRELDGGATEFTLVNVLEAEDTAARNGAGWDVCIAVLGAVLAGEETSGPHGDPEAWRPVYDVYVAAGLPSGAHVPGLDD